MRTVSYNTLIVNMQIRKVTLTTILANLQNLILGSCIMLAMTCVHIHNGRVKLAVRLKDCMLCTSLRVPISKAIIVVAGALCYAESRSKLVAITEVVPVTSRLVKESATCLITIV